MMHPGTASFTPPASLGAGLRLLFGRTFWFLIVCVLLALIAGGASALVRNSVWQHSTHLGLILTLSTALLQCALLLGLLNVTLHICDGRHCRISELAAPAHRAPAALLAACLALARALFVALPALSFALAGALLAPFLDVYTAMAVIAGTVAAVMMLLSLSRYLFVFHILADSSLGALAAMRTSAAITRDERSQAALLLVLLILINLCGALCAGLGLLLSIPWSLLAVTCAYRRITGLPTPAHQQHSVRPTLSPLPEPFVSGT